MANNLTLNRDGKTFNQTIIRRRLQHHNDTNLSTSNDTTGNAAADYENKTKVIQLSLNTSGNDHLMFYYNKQQLQMIQLSNETLMVNIINSEDIGLLGVFDTSETIALTLDF
jgi:hypothetical protein